MKVAIDTLEPVEASLNWGLFVFTQPTEILWWAEKWNCYCYLVDSLIHSFFSKAPLRYNSAWASVQNVRQ